MNRKHQTFVNEVLKHGDKARAYKKVYPTAKDSTLVSASGRLIHRPEIDAAINGYRQELRAELEAEIRAEMKVELAAEMEYKIMLTQIIRREAKIERQVKGANNEPLTLLSDPGFAQMIRAGLVLGGMEGWNMGAKGGERRAEKRSGRAEEEKETVQQRRAREEAAMTQEEIDERRRKGQFINWPYWRVKDYYDRNGEYHMDEDGQRDKAFFLERALEQDREKEAPSRPSPWGKEVDMSWQPKGTQMASSNSSSGRQEMTALEKE